jgi:predicted RNA-binding protein YlqC (UPF0109 family)
MDDILNTDNINISSSSDQGRPQITADKLKEFILYIIQNIVINKEEIEVTVAEDMPGAFTVQVKVAAEDKGRVIGRSGSTINSIRTLVKVFGRIMVIVQD